MPLICGYARQRLQMIKDVTRGAKAAPWPMHENTRLPRRPAGPAGKAGKTGVGTDAAAARESARATALTQRPHAPGAHVTLSLDLARTAHL